MTQFASGSVRRCPAACLMQSGLATRPACSCSRVPNELAVLDSVACMRVGTTGQRTGERDWGECRVQHAAPWCIFSTVVDCSLTVGCPAARALSFTFLGSTWRQDCCGCWGWESNEADEKLPMFVSRARSILAVPAAILFCRGQLGRLGISSTGPG